MIVFTMSDGDEAIPNLPGLLRFIRSDDLAVQM